MEITNEIQKNDYIYFEVVDRDNIGFYFNSEYSILEFLDGEKWVRINKESYQNPYQHDGISRPQKSGYAYTVLFCEKSELVDDFEFKTGHYRATFVLNDRHFPCEFDLYFG